ncbi:hypothetical protein BS78_05G156800 [Paspalum vaginatum]|nr:hypothetical protein BS78_05G156800 [Paspalum vaginatum]
MSSSTTHPTTVLHDIHQRQRADGPAAILAIGTAYPAANCVQQEEFADWYFRVTRSDHLAELKAKTKKICEKSGIKKRHFHHTEEFIAGHPELIDLSQPSLTTRLGIAADAGPALAAAAASRAIADWGRPAADVTHLVVSTNSGGREPGADLRLAGLLGLRPGVRRTLLCLHGCSAGLVALRVAKDIAENNRGARVLVACAQATAMLFGAPGRLPLDLVVAMSLFGDGAGAAILGADPEDDDPAERPIFHLVSASQATVPGTERAVVMSLSETGIVNSQSRLSVEVPRLVRGAIERCLADALEPLGLPAAGSDGGGRNWNGLFWAVHPGGRAILDTYEAALGLEPRKLAASRHVLSEYGNMMGATVIFVLDEIRRRRCRRQDGADEDEEDCEWGVMTGLGPGLTIETIVLHAAGSWGEI